MSVDRQKLLELAEQCEKAEGPDRELDAEIAATVLGGAIVWDTARYTGDAAPVRCYESRDHVGGFGREPVYRYTASLDAALTLVPEGFRWKIGYSRHVPCVAEIVDYRIQMEPNLGRFVSECDNSHALALCAAALRARAAL